MAISALRQPEVFELYFDAHSEDQDGLARILLYGDAAEARAKKAGGALALVGAGKAVRRVFYLTGNGGLLDTSPALVVLNGDGRG